MTRFGRENRSTLRSEIYLKVDIHKEAMTAHSGPIKYMVTSLKTKRYHNSYVSFDVALRQPCLLSHSY